MTWFWGSQKKAQVPTAATAIDPVYALEQSIEQQMALEEKAAEAEHHATKCIQAAAGYLKNKKKADADLQRKRAGMYRKQAVMYRQQANNLLEQSIVVENASINAETHAVMQTTLKTGQQLVQHIDPDEVAETADDWAELHDDSLEIGRALGQPLGMEEDGDPYGLSELDEEIMALMEQEEQVADTTVFPSVPSTTPAVKQRRPLKHVTATTTKSTV